MANYAVNNVSLSIHLTFSSVFLALYFHPCRIFFVVLVPSFSYIFVFLQYDMGTSELTTVMIKKFVIFSILSKQPLKVHPELFKNVKYMQFAENDDETY